MRVMRERSVSVNLMPHIEDACLKDLAEKCSQRTGHGEVSAALLFFLSLIGNLVIIMLFLGNAMLARKFEKS